MVLCNGLLTPTNITEQTEGIGAKDTRGLYCNWDKMVRPGQQSVLLPLSGFSSCATAITSLITLDGVAYVSTQVKSRTRHRPDLGQWNNHWDA